MLAHTKTFVCVTLVAVVKSPASPFSFKCRLTRSLMEINSTKRDGPAAAFPSTDFPFRLSIEEGSRHERRPSFQRLPFPLYRIGPISSALF